MYIFFLIAVNVTVAIPRRNMRDTIRSNGSIHLQNLHDYVIIQAADDKTDDLTSELCALLLSIV